MATAPHPMPTPQVLGFMIYSWMKSYIRINPWLIAHLEASIALNHNRAVTQCKWTSWLMNYANTNLPGLAWSSKSDTTRSGLHVSQSPMSKNSDHHQVPSCEDKACNRRTQQKRSYLQSSMSGLSKVYTGETGCKFHTRLYEHKQHYRLIQTQNPPLLNMLSMKTIA